MRWLVIAVIAVIAAGVAPRRVVRYVYTSGTVGHVERTAKITATTAVTNTVLETSANGVENPMIRWVERVSVGEVSSDATRMTSTVIVVGDDVPDEGRALGPSEVLQGTSSSWTQSASVKEVTR